MIDEDFIPITPINFIQISTECHYIEPGSADLMEDPEPFSLPDTSDLCDEERFAEVCMGWNTEGLELLIEVEEPFQEAFYPEVSRGDSVELFIDTRDVKTS